ncbi:MAG: hypothetical protein WBM70_07030, partial [Sulfurovum sp.]|uniref:hypothetical protein n=1 Tax=Sulfurovum sp. TaxID=1969726 RepID=UPI003C78F8D5
MFRLFYITILLILPLQTVASTFYTVRIAVYNNADTLQHELNKLSPTLRKTIQIKKRGNQHVASSVQTDKKEALQKLLPSYQKVFPDAFISSEQTPDVNTTESNRTIQKKAQTIEQVPQVATQEPIEVNNTVT